jgi:hypothetical protein
MAGSPGHVADVPDSDISWIDLCDLCVPKNWCSELEDVTDVFSESCRLNPFSPRYIWHFAESELLHFVRYLLAFCLVGRAHPFNNELFELRYIRPAEPGVRPCARYAEVDGLMTSAACHHV